MSEEGVAQHTVGVGTLSELDGVHEEMTGGLLHLFQHGGHDTAFFNPKTTSGQYVSHPFAHVPRNQGDAFELSSWLRDR